MRDVKRELADRIIKGEQVALYCYGILADYLLAYLDKFYDVHPAVVIDNDVRKKGMADYDVSVMPYMEAKERYGGLKYFICSDDFKYTIIGDLLEKGEKPEDIINYVPVENRKSCLYFYNRLLLVQGKKDERETHYISHCNADSFKSAGLSTAVAKTENGYSDAGSILDGVFKEFENGQIDICDQCVMNREQYLVKSDYPKHYKSLAFYQQTCEDCVAHCVYCCVGGNHPGEVGVRYNSLEGFSEFVSELLSLHRLDDDFTCAMDMSERHLDEKMEVMVRGLQRAGVSPMVYKINSCHLSYSDLLGNLMRQGKVYTIWSVDAGSARTYREIKQIDAFERVLENIKKYTAEDAFQGKFIVPKYLIVKGMNDNEREFDLFLDVILSLDLKYVALSFDFYTKAEDRDVKFIQQCYEKIERNGLRLTYKNNSRQVTQALGMNNIQSQ